MDRCRGEVRFARSISVSMGLSVTGLLQTVFVGFRRSAFAGTATTVN